jgi:type IV secretory pathway VirB4 component
MFNLSEYRARCQRLADYLPWAALIADGVVLNKDGSLQRTARFRGPDLDSATPAELVATTARLNNALRRLGSGWAIFVEAQRLAANHYPECEFPDAASRLVDAERRAQFEEEGAHYESRYFLTFVWLPRICIPASRPSFSAYACQRCRCTSMRSSRMKIWLVGSSRASAVRICARSLSWDFRRRRGRGCSTI